MERQLSGGTNVEDVKIDIRIINIKPLHARWLVAAIDKLRQQKDLIKESLKKAGI